MSPKVASALDDIPLRNLKCEMPARQKVTPHGSLIELAMNCAELEPKQLADAMGVSTSFLLRGFKDSEHISWQRLQEAGREYPQFKEELLRVQARHTDGVRARLVFEMDERRSA